MLQNAYLLAKIGADTAENERKFAENLPNFAATLLEQVRCGIRQVLLLADLRSIGYRNADWRSPITATPFI